MAQSHDPEMVARAAVRRLDSQIAVATVTSLADLCQRVADLRGRPIDLLPVPLPVKMDGLWVATQETDYIVFASNAERVAQEHAICHELGHIILNHRTSAHDLHQILHSLTTNAVHQAIVALRSAHLDTPHKQVARTQEQEADFFAIYLEEQLSFESWFHTDVSPLPAMDPGDRAIIERFISSVFPFVD